MNNVKKIYNDAIKSWHGFRRDMLHTHYYRPMFDYIYNNFNDNSLNGAEIGVAEGYNARNILYKLNINKLYLVDPWEDYIIDIAKNRLKKYNDKIVYIKKYSSDAINDIPDNLDFIYIDANHNYNFIKKDIELYFPKVRIGGIFGGHDFFGNYQDVIRAVMEFSFSNKYKLYTKQFDWWFIK